VSFRFNRILKSCDKAIAIVFIVAALLFAAPFCRRGPRLVSALSLAYEDGPCPSEASAVYQQKGGS
jgi:hypothetical protein